MKREIIANTFTPIYDEVEDRLRFVINYQDVYNRVDLMITRSFVLNLIPSAEEFLMTHCAIEEPKYNFEEKKENEGTAKTDSINLVLLQTNEELLLEVNLSFEKNTKQTLLTLSSKNIKAKAQLDCFMLQQVFRVMKKAIPYIKWGVSHHF